MNIKNILYATMIGAACAGFTACDDDNGSNPTLTVPESFLLNTPVLSENPIDLEETSDSIALYWSQPNYGGFPAVTTYNVQYALSDNFDELIQRQEENEEFVGVIQMDEPLNVCNTAFAPSDFNRNLIKLAGVSSVDELPEEMDVFFRIVAKTYSTEPIYSNIVKIKVQPFFQALQAAAEMVLGILTISSDACRCISHQLRRIMSWMELETSFGLATSFLMDSSSVDLPPTTGLHKSDRVMPSVNTNSTMADLQISLCRKQVFISSNSTHRPMCRKSHSTKEDGKHSKAFLFLEHSTNGQTQRWSR